MNTKACATEYLYYFVSRILPRTTDKYKYSCLCHNTSRSIIKPPNMHIMRLNLDKKNQTEFRLIWEKFSTKFKILRYGGIIRRSSFFKYIIIHADILAKTYWTLYSEGSGKNDTFEEYKTGFLVLLRRFGGNYTLFFSFFFIRKCFIRNRGWECYIIRLKIRKRPSVI